MAMRFLFWNVGRRGNPRLVADVGQSLDVDVLVLAEADFDEDLCSELNSRSEAIYWFPAPVPGARLRLHTRLPAGSLVPIADKNFLSAFHVQPSDGLDMLLVAAHCASKLHLDRAAQAALSPRIRESIEEWEERLGHNRTVVTGDFNMNPFEDGVMGSEGLHAVMTRADARRRSRRVLGQKRRFFYNPMWRLFGERQGAPAGTYRDNGTGPLSFFWNMFDQVVVRPELLEYFDDDSVRVITRVGQTSLATRSGRPNHRSASDHFPILFEITGL
jgi:hypothetical protein